MVSYGLQWSPLISNVLRDGLENNAILYIYPGCLLGHVNQNMKEYCKSEDQCHRRLLLQNFIGGIDSATVENVKRNCCDFCTRECMCTAKYPVQTHLQQSICIHVTMMILMKKLYALPHKPKGINCDMPDGVKGHGSVLSSSAVWRIVHICGIWYCPWAFFRHLWSPMVSYGLQLSPFVFMVSNGLLWYLMVSCGLHTTGLQWSTMVSIGLLWSTMVSYGLQWSPLVYTVSNGLLWSPMVSCGLQWSLLVSMVTNVILWSPMVSIGHYDLQ